MSLSEEGVVWKRRGGRDQMEQMDLNHLLLSSNNSPTKKHDQEKEKTKKKKKKKGKRYDLVSFKDLPDYMKDNEYILNYYRANWPIKVAFSSLFHWHNETLNVWTHLIGFVVFLGLTMVNLMQVPQVAHLLSRFTRSFTLTPATLASNNSKYLFLGVVDHIENTRPSSETSLITQSPAMVAQRWPFFIFLLGSMFCLLTSSMCHLFCCHSKRLNILLLQLDYVGITVMIITSFFPPIFYIFQCSPHWQLIYLSAISLIGLFAVATLLSPPLISTSACRRFRALLFFSMGFSSVVPAVHALILNWTDPRRFVTLAYESAMALSYATGTLFYVSRVPERWRPGWFDLAGHSHQIFHVFVIMGALAHYGAALVFLQWRDEVGCNP